MDEKRYAESVAMSQKALQLNDENYLVSANLMSAYQALDQKDNFAAARDHAIGLLEEKVNLEPQDALAQVSPRRSLRPKGLRRKRSLASNPLWLAPPRMLKSLNLRAKPTRISATVPELSSTSRKPCKRVILSMTSRALPTSKIFCTIRNLGPMRRSRILKKENEQWRKVQQLKLR